ncbi:hypothetical protein [Streptomyces sp. ODS28]|uniref:hypothetical protein n=1 Tax=Streptomyces sp. ODS28 TaxID=3136688 RepID=UPI0031EA0249
MERRSLSRPQKLVLAAAFVPMLATGVAGGVGTYSNVSGAYGRGTALGAVAAGEGATAVLALVLLGLTMLGQSSPWPVRAGLWALPAAASVMAAMAADDPGRTVIYAVTPMGMCVAAEGMAFLARRIVVHTDGRDAEAEAKSATVLRALAYHRARAANHPDAKVQRRSVRTSWRLARKVGTGDTALGEQLVTVQRERVTTGADAALADMFAVPVTPAVTGSVTPALPAASPAPGEEGVTESRDATDTQVTPSTPVGEESGVTPAEPEPVAVPDTRDGEAGEGESVPVERSAVTLAEVAAVAGVTAPEAGVPLSDAQLVVVLRYLRHSIDPPMSYRQAATAFREGGFVGAEGRVRAAWSALIEQEENAP